MSRTAKFAAIWPLVAAIACDNPSEPKPKNPADALPPSITVTSPARGAMLEGGTYDPSPVTVAGEACHESSPITSLSVNGVSVTVSGDQLCEDFSVALDSPWGMTGVTVIAQNKLGREATDARAFLRSPTYYPAVLTRDINARLTPGALMRFTSFGTNKILAPINGAAGPFALGSLIANPIQNTEPAQPPCIIGRLPTTVTGYRVERGTVSTPVPVINAVVVGQQTLQYTVRFSNVTMPVTVTGYAKTSCASVLTSSTSGSIAENVTSTVNAITGIRPTTGGITSGVTVAGTNASGVTINLNLDGITFLTAEQKAGIMSLLYFVFTESISDEVENITRVRFAGEFLKLPASVMLPARNLTEIGLDLDAVVGEFSLTNGGMTFGFATQVVPLTPRTGDAPAKGSIRTAPAARPVGDSPTDIAYGVNYDFLNAILWAAWQGGSFDAADLATLVGNAPGLTLSLRSLMPPVITRADAGAIRISWGDVQLSGTIDPAVFRLAGETATAPVNVEAHANVVVDGTLGLDAPSGRLLLLQSASNATVQLNHVATVKLDDNAIQSAIRDALQNGAIQLLRPVIRAIPIGEAVLASFANFPPGTTIPVWESGVKRAVDYEYVWGRIQSSAPAPAPQR